MAERALTVVQILPALASGGVERGTLEVARELVRRGHRSIVIAAGGRLADQLQREGSEHIAWPVGAKSPLTLRFVPRLRRLLAECRVDILHARSRLPAWIAWLAWRGMDPATRPHFVTTVHGFYSVNRYSAIMTRGERVIAVSNAVRDYVLTNKPFRDALDNATHQAGVPSPGGRGTGRGDNILCVIHRGVDAQEFPYGYQPDASWLAQWRHTLPQLQDQYLVTLPARLTRWKGQEHLIDIIGELRRRGVPAHGLLVGEADARKHRYADELRAAIQRAGLAAHISLLGHRTDLRDIMALSHAVVSLSLEPEAFGRTTLEALSLGRPVAGYDHGGVGEQLAAMLPEGRVPVGDRGAMATLLERWYHSPPIPAAAQPFTLQRMLDATLALYADLVHQATPSRIT